APATTAPATTASTSTAAPALRVLVIALAAAVILWPAGPGAGPATAEGRPMGGGARLWSGRENGATILVVAKARPGPLLTDLRNAGVRQLDVVVVTSASDGEEPALDPVLARHPSRLVLTPVTTAPGDSLVVGRLRLDVTATEPRLEVRIRRCTAASCPTSRRR
ncbi:MAG: hypothetical protein M3P85_12280, partial [Actinomycetota bacterium]|nr:hypothetical protein [Actinomycetota bacterium]